MKTVIYLILFLISVSFYGQSTILQDGSGETSLQLMSGNAVFVNLSNELIGFTIQPKKYSNENPLRYNFTLAAKSKENISQLVSGGKPQFKGKMAVNTIWDHTEYGSRNNMNEISAFLYQFFTLEGSYSRYTVFDDRRTFDNQIYGDKNFGIRMNYGWNLINYVGASDFAKKNGGFSFGAAGSVGYGDNTGELDKLHIITSSKIISNGTMERLVSNEKEVYDASEISKNHKYARINADVGMYFLKSRFFANLHFNSSFDDHLKPSYNPAFGIFLTGEGAPLEALVGIQVQSNDFFNSRFPNKSRSEKTDLVLTVGFPFD